MYNIYRSDSADGQYEKITWVNSNQSSYKNDRYFPQNYGITVGKTYYYKISFTGTDIKESELSASDYGYATIAVAPRELKVSTGTYGDRIHLDWLFYNSGVTFNIYRAESLSGTFTKIASTSTSDWENTTTDQNYPITIGTTYYYFVTSADSFNNESSHSDTLSGYASSTGITAPTGVSATQGTYSDRIVVSWDAVAAADKYEIYRSTSENGTYNSLLYVDKSKTTWTDLTQDGSVVVDTHYYYKIYAVKMSGSTTIAYAGSEAALGYASSSGTNTTTGNLKIVNNSSVSLPQLYCALSSDTSWGNNLLSSGAAIASGSTYTIAIPPGTYDAKLTHVGTNSYPYNTYGKSMTITAGNTYTLTVYDSGFTGVLVLNNTSGMNIDAIYLSTDNGVTWGANILTSSMPSGYYWSVYDIASGTAYRVKIVRNGVTTTSAYTWSVSSLSYTTVTIDSSLSF